MFSNMRKHEKSWNEFCEWLEKNHDFYLDQDEDGNLSFKIMEYLLEDASVLPIIPFFFDEKNIYIEICNKYSRIIDLFDIFEFKGKNRQEALILACEKAFEILDKQLEEKA